MLLLREDQFKIYVYANDYESGPHCHIIFNDNSEISVDIPSIMPRYGAILSTEVRQAIEENLELIWTRYEELNPARIYKTKKKIKRKK